MASKVDQQIKDILALAELLRQEKEKTACETSFRTFVKAAWKVVEPGVTYVHGWHIDALCEHLEAANNGEIRKLIINVPPRTSKSSICAVMFPAWVWINSPEQKFLYASYGLHLSMRDSRKCRMLIGSAWYQRNWQEKFAILSSRGGQDSKQRFDNDRGGVRQATATNVGTTGGGGNFLCLPADELVWTEHGKIPIRDIVDLKIDCRAWSLNTATGDVELKPISNWFHNPGSEILEIGLGDGSTIRCTPNHKIWTVRGWVRADTIGYNDVLPRASTTDIENGFFGHAVLLRKGTAGTVRADNFNDSFYSKASAGMSPRSSLPVAFKSESICSVSPTESVANRYDGVPATTELRSQTPGTIQTGSDQSSFFERHNGTRTTLKSTVPKCIANVLASCSVGEINQGGVSTVPIRVANLLSDRTFSDKMAHNELVGEVNLLDSIEAQIVAGVTLIEPGTKNSFSDVHRAASARDDTLLTSHSAEFGDAVSAFESSDRKPAFIRSCGFAHDTYCITVQDNHNFFAGNGINFITVANCYDDPNDLGQMNSDAYIEQVIFFHEHVMASRLDDPKTGVRILIQQRSGERDLTGHILEKEAGWEHLVIPMEYEGDTKVTSIGWKDKRTTAGELMCPERIGPEEVKELKRNAMLWAGQYQQRPAPGEGAKFKRDWWEFYNPPGVETNDKVRIKNPGTGEVIEKTPKPCPLAFEQVVQAWDMSFKNDSEHDLVAGHAWGRVGANVFLLKRDTERRDFPETIAAVREMSAEFPCPEKLVEGKANGPAVIQTLRNEIPGMIESPINQGVIELATSMTGYVEAGNVHLPNPNLYPWVWEFIEQFSVFPRGKHDDDVAAASHAWRRLFDSVANSAAPEFRVMPRLGEPTSACHIVDQQKMFTETPAHWRRWIAVAPGQIGSAIWFAETPQGSLRIYRELLLDNVDANESGRLIMEHSLPDIRSYMKVVHLAARWNIDVLMEKQCFQPIEPIGCYAEALEQGLMGYKPTGGPWEERESVAEELKLARFSSQMAEPVEAAFEHLRDLLKFKPEDYEQLSWNREKAIQLADSDFDKYRRYFAAVEGKVVGEWPKIKFSSECKNTIAALGAARRSEDIADPFLRALLIGISAPPKVGKLKPPQETPWPQQFKIAKRLYRRRFA